MYVFTYFKYVVFVYFLFAAGFSVAGQAPIPYYEEGTTDQLGLVKGPTDVYEIPFHAGSGGNTSIIIDLKFNGSDRSYPFCLDTGCPYSIIDTTVAQELNLPPLAHTATEGDADFNFSSVAGCRPDYWVDSQATRKRPSGSPPTRTITSLLLNFCLSPISG